MNKIINAIDISPEDDKLYLIEKYSEIAGFFVSNKKLIYMAKNIDLDNSNSLQTEYLKLRSNINIISVENSQNFDSGFYNLIEYRLQYKENIQTFESFLNLCIAHIKLMNSKNFVDFFNSLIDLFQNKSKEKKQNVYGLFGELSLIHYIYIKHNINLTPYWHTSGSYSKYDFSVRQKNIEVKTSNSIKNVLIKHSQIFNDDQNYLAVALVENNNSGFTLKELEAKLLAINEIRSDFNFVMNLELEKSRIDASDYSNKNFKLIGINIYDCNKIKPFINIPENISEITYRIDLLDNEKVSEKEIKCFLGKKNR